MSKSNSCYLTPRFRWNKMGPIGSAAWSYENTFDSLESHLTNASRTQSLEPILHQVIIDNRSQYPTVGEQGSNNFPIKVLNRESQTFGSKQVPSINNFIEKKAE